MPAKYASDYETAIAEVKHDRNMTNDELKDIDTKNVVLYKRDDRMMTKVKRAVLEKAKRIQGQNDIKNTEVKKTYNRKGQNRSTH